MVAQVLPSGTVTFLFTDIEASTKHWEEEPRATARALARHDELLRRAVTARAGVVFAHTGDGMAAVFPRAADAVEAAVDAQRALLTDEALRGVKVRMAVHTGEAEERDGNYFGPALNRTARLMGLAAGGQALVSLATAEVVRDRMPDGVSLLEVGERTLPSLSRPERVFALQWSTPPSTTTVEVQVLGPLRLLVDGAEVAVPGPRRRAVLALLAMAAPASTSADSLLLAAWQDDQAGSSVGALQNVISRLRRHLGPAAHRLETGAGGYRLRLDDGALDATRLTAVLARARTIMDQPQAAIALVDEARRMYRGRPLEEFVDVDALAGWRRSLDEQRRAAADLRAELALATGDRRTAIDVAGATVAEEPLRETSVLLLVDALAGDGRAAEALRVAHDHRCRLAEETGLEPSPALGALEQRIAAGTAPPLPPVTATSRRSGTRSPLIGRDAELAAIARLCRSEPLVTLLGPGGVGKTSLALEVAARDRTGRAVATVQLASVDEAAVVDAVAVALGLRGTVDDPQGAIVALLGSKPWLLVLDNCEHVLRPVRQLVDVLTESCPELTVLATSRQRLGVAIEQLCPIAPLPVPREDQRSDLDVVPAVALFVERAARARPGFQPDDEDFTAVAGIVRRLDGIPLAIELAAGRLAALGLHDVATRMDRALDLLAAGADLADGRHTTLRAALEWSYELLTPDEQRLFRTLSVFPDGFDLATAERLATSVTPSLDPASAVAQLAEASMLVTSFGPTVRYRMLEMLRAFGLDRLAAHGELAEANAWFLEWVEQLVAWIDATAQSEEEPAANDRLLAEFDTIRAAWHAARAADDVDRMLRLIRHLYLPAAMRELREVWLWTIELAQHPALVEHPRRGFALAAASIGTGRTGGDLGACGQLAARAAEVPDSGDLADRVIVLDALSTTRLYEGRLDEAVAAAVEAAQVSVASRAGQLPFFREAMWAQAGYACAYAGRLDDARAYNANGRDAPYPSGRSVHHYAAGEIENAAGNWADAQHHYQESIRLSERSGATFAQGLAAVGLVTAQASAGELEKALVGYAELIERWNRTGAWLQQWTTLRNLADLLDRLDDRETATALRAAAEASADASAPQPITADGIRPDRRPAAAASREEVLRTARDAIDCHLKAMAQVRNG